LVFTLQVKDMPLEFNRPKDGVLFRKGDWFDGILEFSPPVAETESSAKA
jgi:hypothetical protein